MYRWITKSHSEIDRVNLPLTAKKYYDFLKAHSRVSFQNPMLHCHAHKIAFFIILNSKQFKKKGAELTETEAVFLVMCDPPMNEP